MNPDPIVNSCTRRLSSLGLLAVLAIAALLLPLVPCSAADDGNTQSFPFMQPDEETLQRWIDSYENAPLFDYGRADAASTTGHVDLLQYLDYLPSENSQGACGNCWAWAGTSALGIALDVQTAIYDRLSVQFINSCQQSINGRTCCEGGWLADFAEFYDVTGYCIPWSNEGAEWQDGTNPAAPHATALRLRHRTKSTRPAR